MTSWALAFRIIIMIIIINHHHHHHHHLQHVEVCAEGRDLRGVIEVSNLSRGAQRRNLERED